MKGMVTILLFTALVMVCWGVYGPVLDNGKYYFDVGNENVDKFATALRAFICVGLAYFLIAVLVPVALLQLNGEVGKWTATGAIWSLIAGAGGALGALGVILALGSGGNPLYVMPLVFGTAPVVNTFTTMLLSRNFKIGPLFSAGLILVVAGSAAVLIFRPSPHGAGAANMTIDEDSTKQVKITIHKGPGDDEVITAKSSEELERDHPPVYKLYLEQKAAIAAQKKKELTPGQLLMVALFTAMTALSWGAYGPTLHKGQSAMSGSRLRPLLCVGVAYMLIAVVIPGLILLGRTSAGGFTSLGTLWSLAGGATGAIGALGVIMAFNFGGKPIYVMPLVFGGAPIINTFVSLWGKPVQPGVAFYAGLLVAIAGAVTVLLFAPRPDKKPGGAAATSAAH